MKVFVTGASGFVGSAVVPELLKSGHKVLGLARSDDAERKIKALGPNVEVVRGGLLDVDVLAKAASEADGVVHLGFIHDFSKYQESCLIDRAAVVAMLDALKGTDKPFVNTAGSLMFAPGVLGTETTAKQTSGFAKLRSDTEDIVSSYKEKGVRACTVRLPPTVHGKNDPNFISFFINVAKKSGKSAYIGDGQNVWPAVARLDAARLFRFVLEKGRAGAAYHAIAQQGIKTKEIAGVIGQLVGVPVVSVEMPEAAAHFGVLTGVFSADGPASSKITREELGWEPKEPELLDDILVNYAI
ncbi:LAME_0F16072g1_1 [Lachancea meyersii CBS 8951]|uniref:LAME_0F16072g1_1 n=1 Tax=Lachancea meyersii CBS 8951 TaxID=1266667 RepID=A0A1G4JYX9_9SACH|nr:LAME_0F16072g1_1 [Lachancea meyersii CBS 8951]